MMNIDVINKGIEDNIQVDAVFYITRMGKLIGSVKVIQVDEYSSVCVPVDYKPGVAFQKGDLVSAEPPKVKEPPADPDEKEDSKYSEKVKTESEIARETQKAREEYEENVEKRFEEVTNNKSHITQFKRGSGGTVKINAFDVYNNLSTVLFAGPYSSFNVWHGIYSAYEIYASYQSSANPNRVRNVQIEITLWDTEYLDAFASYYALKEAIDDPMQINIIKENIYRQKGLDRFYVFQVKVINPGPGAFQIAPFPWHFYLKDTDGTRIKAVHYDEILDKALNPDQLVNGYIYFDRYDANAMPVLSGTDVTVELVDIMGNNRDVIFK